MDIFIKLNGSRGVVFNKQPYILSPDEKVVLNFVTEFRLDEILIGYDGKAFKSNGNTFELPEVIRGEKDYTFTITQYHRGTPCHTWKCDTINLTCADIGVYNANAIFRVMTDKYQALATRVTELERALDEVNHRINGADIL